MRYRSFIRILRPLNMFITFISVWGGVIIAKGTIYTGDYLRVFLASISAALVAGAGNVINDIKDVEIDKANNKMRPLVTGEITEKEAYVLYFSLNIIALAILILFVSNTLFYIALVTEILLFLYALLLKFFPFFSNVLIGMITGLVFIYAGLLTDTWWYDFTPFFFAAEINFLREFVKDIEDIKGDQANDYYTMAVFLGEKLSKIMAVAFTFILIGSTSLPYLYLKYSEAYLYSVILFVDIPLLFFIYKLLQKDTNYKVIHFTLKASMILGLISLLLGVLV